MDLEMASNSGSEKSEMNFDPGQNCSHLCQTYFFFVSITERKVYSVNPIEDLRRIIGFRT